MLAGTVSRRYVDERLDDTQLITVAHLAREISSAAGKGPKRPQAITLACLGAREDLPKGKVFPGIYRVEPAGIEAATSCLQSRSDCPLMSRCVQKRPGNGPSLVSVQFLGSGERGERMAAIVGCK